MMIDHFVNQIQMSLKSSQASKATTDETDCNAAMVKTKKNLTLTADRKHRSIKPALPAQSK